MFKSSGGIKPLSPCRFRLALTLAEREEISRGLVASQSLRAIPSALGRSASTLSREVSRNGGPDGYRAARADSQARKKRSNVSACASSKADAQSSAVCPRSLEEARRRLANRWMIVDEQDARAPEIGGLEVDGLLAGERGG
ncbi:MAG: hypothetical protein EON61_01565 [Alphaproteobacteria bacterium]|nr:MAG: hypothetical protein EON61_01565 [Alphaproteobacteria bacterium]